MKPQKRIGFLATGSEIVSGEILNTNGQKMAQQLIQLGCNLGEHLVVDDVEANMEQGLAFLLDRHDVVIVSGGLGPTSDDRTRFVMAKLANQELVFSHESWQRIEDRLSKKNLPIPKSNRQQAWFPENADILINEYGTADGAIMALDDKVMIMLPGPPRECLPMFERDVIRYLEQKEFTSDQRLYRWRLMGVSESQMAEALDELAKPYGLQFAYRAAYPYLDVKLTLSQSMPIDQICREVEQAVAPFLVTTERSNISTQLKKALIDFKGKLTIDDQATRGYIFSQLSTEESRHSLSQDKQDSDYLIKITGFDEYWQQQPNQHMTKLQVELVHQNKSHRFEHTIYLRGQESLVCAVEFCAHQIYKAWFKLK